MADERTPETTDIDSVGPSGRRGFLTSRSPYLLALLGAAIILGVSGGGYYAYRTYDYVQHDNNFCVSCHLMEQPFELFGESAHQGLGCKACHQPNLLERSQMGLTQVVDNPTEITVHSEVPNEICADCHIDGDPDKWRPIANSAGHQVHLESDDPALDGLMCVECHASSLHQFAPIDETCAQSACHQDQPVQLGSMGDLTIHCAACHNFVAPVGEPNLIANVVDAAILPSLDDCLSCHVMRQLVDMPEPDPHQGTCAACHNPHTQTDPSEAVGSCASAGCHEDAESLTPFHRGVQQLDDCTACHQAHDFSLDPSDCAQCHEGIESPSDPASSILGFAHDQHEVVECASCHVSEESHGAPTATSVQDCRSCHHTVPVVRDCARCHRAEDAPVSEHSWPLPIQLEDVGLDDPSRSASFPHGDHNELDCATCHTDGLALSPTSELDCQSCHEEHHTAVSDCASCHLPAPAEAHPPDQAHVTCSGAGCHTDVPFESVPRTREFCLGCHQDLTEHEPDRPCAECHTLPAPTGGGP